MEGRRLLGWRQSIPIAVSAALACPLAALGQDVIPLGPANSATVSGQMPPSSSEESSSMVPLIPFARDSVSPSQADLTAPVQDQGSSAAASPASIPGGEPAAAAPEFVQGPVDPLTGGVPFTNDAGEVLANLKPGTLVNKLVGQCGTDYCRVRVPDLQYGTGSDGNVSYQGYEGNIPVANVGSTMPAITMPAGDSLREQYVQHLETFLGEPYCWEGASHRCTDCSGLTSTAALETGVRIPRTAEEQQKASIPVRQPQLGDLGFAPGTGPSGRHVVAYVGNNQVIQAIGENYGVRRTSVNIADYQWGDFLSLASPLKH